MPHAVAWLVMVPSFIGQGLLGSDSEGTTCRQGGKEALPVEGWEATEVIRKLPLVTASPGRFAMVTQ